MRIPSLMGVVNVTPDSFSDGGLFAAAEAAIGQGRRLAAEGAALVDVGGESTRPGAAPVSPDEEWRRIGPAIGALAAEGIAVSVDTRNAATMRRALAAGARAVNDVTGLTHDPESLAVVAASGAQVFLMHMKGTPETMAAAPSYDDVVGEVRDWLAARVAACEAAGIGRERIVVDPGLGFAKNSAHNASVLRRLDAFRGLAGGLMVGASRKGLLREVKHLAPDPADRLGASLAFALWAARAGADWLRVHDVAATAQALAVWAALDAEG